MTIIMVVAGEIDTIEILQGRDIDDVIDVIKRQAIEKAVQNGARRGMSLMLLMRDPS
jgi:hypothetical protein